MRFRLLGPLEVFDGTAWRAIGAARRRSLLTILLIHAGQVVSVDRIAAELWGDSPPKTASNQVHGYVARLRQLLADRDGVLLATRSPGYQLRLQPGDTDLGRFTSLVTGGRAALHAGDMTQASERLSEAISLWRGPAFADVEATPLVAAEANRLQELRLTAVEARVEADLAGGRHDALVDELQTLTREHPLRERLWDQLMMALYRCGRRAEAITAYHDVRALLHDELGIDPSPTLQDRYGHILRTEPGLALPPAAGTAGSRHRLWRGGRCQVSRLVGREADRRAVAGLLASHQLVTVTGAGGCGKSTLALRVADDVTTPSPVAPPRHDRVLVLPLAALTSVDQAVSALGDLLNVRDPLRVDLLEGIEHALEERPTLLVVDNCEHLVVGCATLCERLLASCRDLTVLATSRQPLGVAEEAVWPLEPLAVPAAGVPVDPRVPAVELFLTRAQAALPTRPLDPEEMADVAAICRRLDGLPLAIELAAARVRAFTVGQIAARLADGFELLTHGTPQGATRHGTLATTIDWSYRLLDDAEQRLLDRLSVFTGSFQLDTAEAVCGFAPLSPTLVAPTLAALVDRSLVQPVDTGTGRRFRLLQAVRAVAAERLSAAGDRRVVADQHLDHWRRQACELDSLPGFRTRINRARMLSSDMSDVRAAIEHAYTSGRTRHVAEVTAHLFELWLANPAYLPEGERWLGRSLAIIDDEPLPPAVTARLRFNQAVLLGLRGNLHAVFEALTGLTDDLARHRPREYLESRAMLLTTRRALLDPTVVTDVPATVAATCTPEHLAGYASNVRTVLTAAGWVLATWGRYAEAAELSERYERIESPDGPQPSYAQQGLRIETAIRLGHRDRVEALTTDLLRRLPQAPDPGEQDTARRVIALAYLATGQPDRAREFLADAIGWLRSTYPRLTLKLSYHHALHAEALRQCGDPEAGLPVLADGLLSPPERTHPLFALPCVVSAALLAADLRDERAKTVLASRWDGIRRRVGLPVPTGFEHAAKTVLGLEPDAPTRLEPAATDLGTEVLDLLAFTRSWCRSRGDAAELDA